jgi:hypothetical protein
MKYEIRNKNGFTFMEVVVGTALFLLVATAALSAFVGIFKLVNASTSETLATQLADEQFEIVRNLPYSNVGLTNGIPLGVLPQTQTLVRGGYTFTVTLTIRNINLATSSLQASDKLVQVTVTCPNCQDNFKPVILSGQVSPANLQSASNGGALVVQAFDSNGQPVSGATVNMQSTATSSITNTDTTNNAGILSIIGVPPGANVYRITVSKSGYSTDQTYPLGAPGNPNPIKPHATVLQQQVTQASFAIDRLSSFNFTSVTPLCAPVSSYHFSMTGAKEIGIGVPKYSANLLTNGSGVLNLPSMEWDTYTVTPTDGSYDLAGINPYSPIALNPNNAQNVQMVVLPKVGGSNSLMVTVADSATKLPISGATVELAGPSSYDDIETTGQGYISQTDWSGGSGQNTYLNQNKYFGDNGNVDTSTSSGNILLKNVFGSYALATGTLESSTFDTGTTSNFYTFSWTPLNQPQGAGTSPVKFQFATNASSTDTIWNYLGPDGTSNSYYSVPGAPIAALHNGKEYARYLAYLTTDTATVTPMVSNVSFAYTSTCIPPGQILFQGLTAGSYTLTISKSGYTTWSGPITIVSGWQQQTVLIGP